MSDGCTYKSVLTAQEIKGRTARIWKTISSFEEWRALHPCAMLDSIFSRVSAEISRANKPPEWANIGDS